MRVDDQPHGIRCKFELNPFVFQYTLLHLLTFVFLFFQVRERLRVSLERVATLEEELSGANQEVRHIKIIQSGRTSHIHKPIKRHVIFRLSYQEVCPIYIIQSGGTSHIDYPIRRHVPYTLSNQAGCHIYYPIRRHVLYILSNLEGRHISIIQTRGMSNIHYPIRR